MNLSITDSFYQYLIVSTPGSYSQQRQNILVGSKVYKCYTNVLCLLGYSNIPSS